MKKLITIFSMLMMLAITGQLNATPPNGTYSNMGSADTSATHHKKHHSNDSNPYQSRSNRWSSTPSYGYQNNFNH